MEGHTNRFIPRLIFWEVTKGCNLRCIHCRASATELCSPDDLNTEEAETIINSITEYAKPILIFSGGEPLFRRDIFHLASYATTRGLKVALATNGTLINKEVAEKIKNSGIRRVSISLDGAKASTHDTFRAIPGSFDMAIRGFMNLKEIGMSVQINTTITRMNAHELPDIYDICLKLKADALHIFMLVPVGCGVNIADDQMLPAEEYERLLNWFYDKDREGLIELKATCAPHYFRIMRQRRKEGERLPPSHERQRSTVSDGLHSVTRGCLAGTGVCFISHKGEVFPCGYLPVTAGDLKKESFKEIWEKSPVFNSLRNPSLLKGKCGMCEYKFICEGCRARAYAATGDYLEEEPYCIYTPARIRK